MSSRFLASSALAVASLTLISSLTGCSTSSTPPAPLPTVAQVDLNRYAGAWYEVAALPNRFQAQCVADTQARYRLLDAAQGGGVEVLNRCRTSNGQVDRIVGHATVVPNSGNAKLQVSFFWPFKGDYWVLALSPDYRWVLVGEQNRRFGWVLSRTPQLPAADMEAALSRAEALGYRRGDFRMTPQTQPLPVGD